MPPPASDPLVRAPVLNVKVPKLPKWLFKDVSTDAVEVVKPAELPLITPPAFPILTLFAQTTDGKASANNSKKNTRLMRLSSLRDHKRRLLCRCAPCICAAMAKGDLSIDAEGITTSEAIRNCRNLQTNIRGLRL
jgi:hypothetical protein